MRSTPILLATLTSLTNLASALPLLKPRAPDDDFGVSILLGPLRVSTPKLPTDLPVDAPLPPEQAEDELYEGAIGIHLN